ncbi:hypothetical protein BPOR_0155g00140 [Botrytis porri]|uniref:Nephrocystin 3-like N-terminal domain-containing protein n=1 Tax=Botrytis porri TaxID=87229 RepID=A0A4Z1KVM3_9HELO|nr:hypothetical protein BPOR_0155g00140 [Botrytis porri]
MLSPTDYLALSSEFNRHASSKARNTGELIRETSQFDQWYSSAVHGSIWIKAVPGAGKSVLVASMVQSLSANESLNALGSFGPAQVKVLLTSRPKRYLQQAFKNPQVIYRVKQFAEDDISGNMQSFIQNTSIKSKEHDEVLIREVIVKLPVGLEEMYIKSARPMRLIEFAKAIQHNPHRAKNGRDAKEIVRSSYGALLKVMEDGVVQILHHSFTEFLLDGCTFSSYPISNDAKDGGGNLEQSMRLFGFGRSFVQFPLAKYAAKNWTYHAKAYDCEDTGFYEKLEEFCKSESQTFKAWSRLAGALRNSPNTFRFWPQFGQALASEMTSHLQIASSFGLGCWTQRLLENGADVEKRDSTENTPLFWAAK